MAYKTLRELYLQSVRKYRTLPCSSLYGGESLTYADFERRVRKVVGILTEAGLGSGDKVALLSSNMPNWAVTYFATVSSGMVIVPILPDFSPEELGKLIEHCEAKALFISDKLFSKVPRETCEKMNLIVRTKNLGVIQSKQAQKGAIYSPGPDDLAAIIYTSGTTSAPKGVMLSHGNLASQIHMDQVLYPINSSDIFLSILPLSHTYECSLGMLFPFSEGASVVYLDKQPTAAVLMPAMKAVRPTIMLSVPLVIEKIYRSQVAKRFNRNDTLKTIYSWGWFRRMVHAIAGHRLRNIFGGRLRFFGVGGAKLDAHTERFLCEANFPYAIGYGLTETAPLIAGALPGKVKFRSTGPVMEGVLARIDNADPATGDGEIVVLSPSTMKGYYKNPEATKSVFTSDGWFRTKDLGCFDEQGNLFIKGRVDNMIVGASGENVYPEEIESVINSHLLVTDSIVTEEKGKLVARVRFDMPELERKYHDMKESLSHRMAEIREELKAYVNSKVNKSSQISEVTEEEKDFEKTPTQKIKRFKYKTAPRKTDDSAAGTQTGKRTATGKKK